MKNINFINTINITEDNYVEVRIDSDVKISTYQFSVINNKQMHLINCTKDRYEEGCLLYYIDNLVPLKNVLATDYGDFISLKKLILKITNILNSIIDKKLSISNIILNLDYIFIDKYTKDIKMIYIPAEIDINLNQGVASFQSLLKEIVSSIEQIDANELISFISNKANSSNLDIIKFKHELETLKKNIGISSKLKNMDKGIRSYIITVLFIMISCLIIPFVGNLLNISLITKYIDFSATIAFAIMFGTGALTSLGTCLLVNSRDYKDKKNLVQHSNLQSNNKVQSTLNETTYDNDKIEPFEEISISNLNPAFLERNQVLSKPIKECMGDKEYNPRSFSSSIEAKEINKTIGLDIKDNKKDSGEVENSINVFSNDMSSKGTQLLFQKHELQSAYLIKEGNTTLADRVYINNQHFNIGRNKDNSNLVIDEKVISKQHAAIELIDKEYFIIDKNSSNCTFLNDIQLMPNKKYKLNHGDKIIFGNQSYKFFSK